MSENVSKRKRLIPLGFRTLRKTIPGNRRKNKQEFGKNKQELGYGFRTIEIRRKHYSIY